MAIQSGECQLNGKVETRRAKKLVPGDMVEFQGQQYNVQEIVHDKGYVFKPKVKKKKEPKLLDDDGTMMEKNNFAGRYRSQEWRQERRQRKIDRNLSFMYQVKELREYLPKKKVVPRKYKPGRSVYPGQKQKQQQSAERMQRSPRRKDSAPSQVQELREYLPKKDEPPRPL